MLLAAVVSACGSEGVVGFVQASQASPEANGRFREATSLRLVAEAESMLAGARSGGDVRAFQQLVVARRLAQTPDDGPLLSALFKRINTIKIAETTSKVNSVAFSPDGKRIVSGVGATPCGCGTPTPAKPSAR